MPELRARSCERSLPKRCEFGPSVGEATSEAVYVVDVDDAAALHQLAYELSSRALQQQEGALNELRARTGTLLAASSLVASFLGARAVADEGNGWLTVLALLVFAGSVAASAYILLPKAGLIFALRGSVLLEAERDDPGGLPETYRRLAYWLESYRDENARTVDRLLGMYRAATGAVVIQVTVWTLKIVI